MQDVHKNVEIVASNPIQNCDRAWQAQVIVRGTGENSSLVDVQSHRYILAQCIAHFCSPMDALQTAFAYVYWSAVGLCYCQVVALTATELE